MRKIARHTRFLLRNITVLFMATILCVSIVADTVLAVDEQFYNANDILFYDTRGQCSTSGGPYQPASGEMTVVQSNIKSGMKGSDYAQAKDSTLEKSPDFVSLNEVGYRSDSELKTPEYDLYRDNSARGQARGTAVLWRKDTWKKLDAGRVLMVEDGPQEWDPGRSATWVTLQNSTSGVASMISVHHMINPAKYGPDMPRRQQLYKEGLEKLNVKISELAALGPVFVAGDFNSQYSADDPWGPRKILGEVGLKATFDSKGAAVTHDGGGTIDYIFHTQNMEVLEQWTKPTPSDHNVLGARFSLSTENSTPTTASPASSTSNADCTCQASSSTIGLFGSNNEEKAFNFFVSKGLSPQQSAGLAGNLKAESGILPARIQGKPAEYEAPDDYIPKDAQGFGIAQWTYGGQGADGTPPYKDRQGALINLSKEKGLKITDLGLQFEFVWTELSPGGSRASAGEELKKATTIREASDVVLIKFEAPLDKSTSVQEYRASLGNDIFGKYGTGISSGAPSSDTKPSSSCGESTTGNGDIVSIAQAELNKGVKEDPLRCDAGNPSVAGTCGAEVDKYTDGTLEYWCADFVSWVLKEAGTPFTGGSSGGWRIASVSSVEAWFAKNGTYTNNSPGVIPKPGDVYTMGISHTGIVEKVEGGKIYTISGNTSTDSTGNGNGVGQGSYRIGDPAIKGFGSFK